MSGWQVITGHDNVGTLADMLQQPAMPGGIQYADPRWAANQTRANHGVMFCDLVFNVTKRIPVSPSDSIREQLLTQFGLSDSTLSAEVTVELRDNNGDWTDYNTTAHLLEPGSRAPGRVEDLTIRLLPLEVIAE